MRTPVQDVVSRVQQLDSEQLQRRLRAWAPDLVAGLLVFVAAWIEWREVTGYVVDRNAMVLATTGTALAVVLTRHQPALALATVWGFGVLQFLDGSQIMLIQLGIVYVAFGTARWGLAPTVWASLLSVPAAMIGGLAYLETFGTRTLNQVSPQVPLVLADWADRVGWRLIAVFVVVVLLLVPWLVGLAVRFGVRASASDASREMAEADAARAYRMSEQAREIAALREEQARLAADVHDVVGHSLAVILAQAESGQFLAEPDQLQGTLATIATSARSSLQDIRQVLAGAHEPGPATSPGSFDELVEGVRSGGHQVLVSDLGPARPLPPDLEVVAHRVMQEMLTNAIKHGRRDRPVFVERHWPEGPWAQDLRIEVRNIAGSQTADTKPIGLDTGEDTGGQGLPGMRRRLEAVGGKLDVRQRDEPEGPTFTVTAWVPVSRR